MSKANPETNVTRTSTTIVKETTVVEMTYFFTATFEVTVTDGTPEWEIVVFEKARGRSRARKLREAVREKTGAGGSVFCGGGAGPVTYEGAGGWDAIQDLVEYAESLCAFKAKNSA